MTTLQHLWLLSSLLDLYLQASAGQLLLCSVAAYACSGCPSSVCCKVPAASSSPAGCMPAHEQQVLHSSLNLLLLVHAGTRPTASTCRYTINRFPKRQHQPTAADKNSAAHSNWQKFHDGPPGSVQQYLQSVSDQLQLNDSMHSFKQQLLQDKCDAATCPGCGSSASPNAAAGAAAVERLFEREVLVVTSSAMISISVPRFKCNRCGCSPVCGSQHQPNCMCDAPQQLPEFQAYADVMHSLTSAPCMLLCTYRMVHQP